MITLEVMTGQAAGAVFKLDLPVLTIGRAPSNQVVLTDYHLSGEHGQIFREDDRYIYRDLRSTNGSRLLRSDGRGEAGGAPARPARAPRLGGRGEGWRAPAPRPRFRRKREGSRAPAPRPRLRRKEGSKGGSTPSTPARAGMPPASASRSAARWCAGCSATAPRC